MGTKPTDTSTHLERDKKRTSVVELITPEWLPTAAKNKRLLKTFCRCLAVFFGALVLLLDNRSLTVFGQATFFAMILSIMLPPTMAISLFIFAVLTLVIGVCLGWAWSCAAMAASLSARSQIVLASAYSRANSSLVPGSAPDAQFAKFVFEGYFLDPRSSAVYGAFFFLGCAFFAWIRAYAPKLTLLSVFGSIILDVMCSYGPLFPSAQYTLATSFLLPTAAYIAIALAGLCIIFPETLSHVWLASYVDNVLKPFLAIVELQGKALSFSEDDTSWHDLYEQSQSLRKTAVLGVQGTMGQTPMVDTEVSRGLLGPQDLKTMSDKLLGLTGRAIGLLSFISFVEQSDEGSSKGKTASQKDGTKVPSSEGIQTKVDRHQGITELVNEQEIRHGHDLDVLRPILSDASQSLRDACQEALKGRIDWITTINSTRWSRWNESSAAKQQADLAKAQNDVRLLRESLSNFRDFERHKLLAPFERFFDPGTGKLLPEIQAHLSDNSNSLPLAPRSLFLCFVFSSTMESFAETLLETVELLVDLQSKRIRNKFWLPTGLSQLKNRALDAQHQTTSSVNPLAMGEATDPEATSNGSSGGDVSEDEELMPRSNTRDPDSTPPRTFIGRFALLITRFFRWIRTPKALFILRYSFVSLALWIVAVHPNSAYFDYSQRGLWALIMAQTGLGVYTGEFILNFFVRMVGTISGLVLGMLAWYIGAGRGPGNPYGIAAITIVLIAPFIFARIAAPPAKMTIWLMTGVMITFVVGYSWIDSHLATVSNPGVGANLAWRRALLVIIGFTAGFIVMLLPVPTSARQYVRKSLATRAEGLVDILASEIDAVIVESSHLHDSRKDPKQKTSRLEKVSTRLFGIAGKLQTLAPSLGTARFEPTFTGPWPAERYEHLFQLENHLIASMALLNGVISRLDVPWTTELAKTPFLNPNLLSDIVTTLSLSIDSLRHGRSLPATLPPLRDRLIYHDRHSKAYVYTAKTLNTQAEELESISLHLPTLQALKDHQLPLYSTAVIALSSILRSLDDFVDTIRDLCGTNASFTYLDALRADYLKMEEEAIRH